jgi:hypothetical protein
MEDAETHRYPHGSVRHVTKRVDMSRFGARKRFRWFPDFRDQRMRARLRLEVAEINERDRRDPELMEFLESLADEMFASLPDYDWGPKGPPV